MQMDEQKIENVASALYTNRYADPAFTATPLPWDAFKESKPEIAEIYRDNARVAIAALAEGP